MKIKHLFLTSLSLSTSLAIAHPGHEAFGLHLHAGVPNGLNTIHPALIATGLFVGSLFLAARLLKKP